MPRGPMTAAHKRAIARGKAAARKRREQTTRPSPTPDPAMNGALVEQRIVLHLQDQTFELTLTEFQSLRDALNHITSTTAAPVQNKETP